jgi:hypothetical protein
MSMTKLRPLAPGDPARADAILVAAKKAADRYRDYRKAAERAALIAEITGRPLAFLAIT